MISSKHVQVRQLRSCVGCDLSVSLDVIAGRRTADDISPRRDHREDEEEISGAVKASTCLSTRQ